MPVAGGKKRARSRNEEEESPSTISTKKQRVKETTTAATEENPDDSQETLPVNEDHANALRRSALARVRRPTQKFAIEDVLVVPGRRVKSAQQTSQENAPSKKENVPPKKKTRPQPKRKLQVSLPDPESSIYDLPESGDELSTAVGTPVFSPRKINGSAPAPETSKPAPPAVPADQPVKRKRGRPRKDQSAAAVVGGSQSTATTSKAKPAGKPPARGRGAKKPEVQDDEEAPSLKVPKVRGRKNAVVEEAQKQPKGILTPTKRGGAQGGKKNVAFDNDKNDTNDTSQESAPDSPSTSIRKNRKKQAPQAYAEPAGSEQEDGKDNDDDDEEVCAGCSKPDSNPGNEIILCDGCDFAVHQQCYDLAEIPQGDWFCRSCSQEEEKGANGGSEGRVVEDSVAVAMADEIPDIPNFDHHLRAMQRVLADRCTGRRRIKPRGLEDVYQKAFQLVEQTIVAGEGNSMLVIGARGCGKTTLVESIISDVSKEHKGEFHVVRLNGFIHTDDKLALREIWRQLGREMEVEDELINKTNNYADTMASLLALLSHPSEIAPDAPQDGVTSKSVIFVIDEFDLFATHARQTLLYNLFDIAQARKAPIAVLGLTTRIDVVESLEKRVKSRFSHRYVYLSLPKSLPAYWDICRQGLVVDDEDVRSEGIDQTIAGHGTFCKWWGEQIEALFKTPAFQDRLQTHFYTTKSVAAFLQTLALPLSQLTSSSSPFLSPGLSSLSLCPPDSKLHLLPALSDLDLSLLVAAARLDIVAHTDTVNFAMAYDEYSSLMGRQRAAAASSGMLAVGGGGAARVWGRGVAGLAWERLVGLGLLVPAGIGGGGARGGGGGAAAGVGGAGGMEGKMWKVDVALEEIPAAVGKMNAVLARWCREI